jgi:hypothetical protein
MTLTQTNQFKKDLKRQIKRGKDLGKLKEVVGWLVEGELCLQRTGITRSRETGWAGGTAIPNRTGS